MRKAVTLLFGAVVVAWIGYTLFMVIPAGAAAIANPEASVSLMSVSNSGQRSSAAGLTYVGIAGGLFAIIEALAVLAALISGIYCGGARRLGALVVIVAWSALWWGNAVWLQSLGWDRMGDVRALGAALIVTLVWAALRIPRRRDAAVRQGAS